MAATVDLPVTTKMPPAADKAPGTTASSSSSESGGFSRALHQQMDKHQNGTPAKAGHASNKSSVSNEKQSVSNKKAEPVQRADGASEQQQAEHTEAEKSTRPAAEHAHQAQDHGTDADAAMVAAMQAPGVPMSQLREMIAMSLKGTSQQDESGKLLPQEASAVPDAAGKLAEIMKLLGLRTSMPSGDGQATQGGDPSALPPGLALLQQRIEQQIALQSQQGGQPSADTNGEGKLDLKQLQGLEQALQALEQAKQQGDTQGLAKAREQLLNRLQAIQQVQAQAGGSDADAQVDDLPGLLKSLTGQMQAQQQKGITGEGDKSARLAFQEMMGKVTATQHQPQSLPASQSANTSALLQSGMSGIAAGSTPQTQNAGLQVATPSTTVNVPVQHQNWGQAIGERLQWMVKQDMKQAEIKLNPRHLGPIEVKISMNHDQATVSFSAHHVMTKDALENAVPRLREMFGDNGLNLLDVNVSQQHPDPRGQQANADAGSNRQGSAAGWSSNDAGADDSTVADIQTPTHWYGSNRMLDTYV